MSTIIGTVLGLLMLMSAIVEMGGGLGTFIDIPALMIVFGGTISATLISFTLPDVFNIVKVSIKLFKSHLDLDLEHAVENLVKLSHKATQGSSIYALERDINQEENPYIKMGITLLVRDAPYPLIAQRFAIEIDGVKARHQKGIKLFNVMAKVAPSFGMVATLLGMINMLRGMTSEISPETLGPSMAVAMVGTLYGALASFLFLVPASEKLKAASMHEGVFITLVRDGILMIKDGRSPRELEQMLNAYLPKDKRRSIVDKLMMTKA